MLNVFLSFKWRLIIAFLFIFVDFEAMANDCLVGACTRRYIDLMDELVLHPTASLQYCRILNEYQKCLDGTKSACLSFLDFHSAQTTTQQNWRQFECKKFEKEIQEIEQDGEGAKNCLQITPSNQQTCAIYGYGHVRQLNNQIQTCWPAGAQTLVDNRFFLVQVTMDLAAKDRKQLSVVSRVTVLFRPILSCTRLLLYQTDLDDSELRLKFADGTSFVGSESDPSIKIDQLDQWTVKIISSHLATEIYIQRIGNQLAVILNAPERVLKTEHIDPIVATKQMCFYGCPHKHHNLKHALAEPKQFGQCHFGNAPSIDIYTAYDKCQEPRVRNHLHSTCAFDLLFRPSQVQSEALHSWHLLIGRLRHYQALRSRPLQNEREQEEERCLNFESARRFNWKLFCLVLFVVWR